MNNEMFFDRKFYLDILEKRIKGLLDGYRQNIAIIADELVGKTSIIFKFLSEFHNNRIITIYIELRPEPLASFTRRFIGILLYNFLINSGIPLKEDIDFLVSKSEKFIPKTIEQIKQILNALQKRKINNILTDLFSLSETMYQETGKATVVILDEFHNLEGMGIKNLYRDWSKILMVQKNTMYIIISSLKFKSKIILSKNLSLLFGNFEVVNVEPFDIKTSEEFLEYKLGGLGLNVGFKNFIVHFTSGYPLYLKVIADSLLKSDQNHLADILENLLFDASGILNQRFSNYLKRFLDSNFSKDYIAILYLIASGRNKIKDITHILRKQKKEFIPRLNHLLELDTVTRNGDFLKINDRVFGFWLKFVYREKLHSLTFDAKNQKEKFRNNIEGMIQEFLQAAQKPIIERASELLRLFEDEIIQVGRKKIRLSHFREIKPLEFNNKNLRNGLICRSHDSIWIMAFKDNLLTEEDIMEFAKECKKYRHKLQRKIIVTLEDIETNARLRALEEKIWTWNLNNLNQILDLYSKPSVIV
jgi:hypothetical protein